MRYSGPLRRVLSFAGTRLLAPIAFGHDPYLDIRRLAQKWSTPVDTVFDVGANIGQTVARTRRIFGSLDQALASFVSSPIQRRSKPFVVPSSIYVTSRRTKSHFLPPAARPRYFSMKHRNSTASIPSLLITFASRCEARQRRFPR